jgi:hypothetical protein
MNKLLLTLFLTLSLSVFSACQQPVDDTEDTNLPEQEEEEETSTQTPEEAYLEDMQELQEQGIVMVPPPKEKEIELTENSVYQQWAYQGEDYFDAIVRDNCIGIVLGDTQTYGDLLSSLIVPNEAVSETLKKENVPTNYQNKNYLKRLEYIVAKHIQDKNLADTFYSYGACNLDNNFDLLLGSTTAENADGYNLTVIRKDSEVLSAHVGLKTLDNTATGAEVYPCTAKIEDENIKYRCFDRLMRDDITPDGLGARFLVYTFDLNGKLISEEYINE